MSPNGSIPPRFVFPHTAEIRAHLLLLVFQNFQNDLCLLLSRVMSPSLGHDAPMVLALTAITFQLCFALFRVETPLATYVLQLNGEQITPQDDFT